MSARVLCLAAYFLALQHTYSSKNSYKCSHIVKVTYSIEIELTKRTLAQITHFFFEKMIREHATSRVRTTMESTDRHSFQHAPLVPTLVLLGQLDGKG